MSRSSQNAVYRNGGIFRVIDDNTRQTAKKLHDRLKGKNFMIIFNFVLDILRDFKFWSENLQRRSGILTDIGDFRENILEIIENYKDQNGAAVQQFLIDVKCSTLDEYYNTDNINIVYKGISLQMDPIDPQKGPTPKLDEIRDKFLKALKDEFTLYFPDGALRHFKIFLPTNLPTMERDVLSYERASVLWLCNYFDVADDCLQVHQEFLNLLLSIIENDSICTLIQRSTHTWSFWGQVLDMPEVAWTDSTKKLIKTVLVQAVGSAEAERGFSIMNHLKAERRSTLSAKHVEDEMRIRINGPDDMKLFVASKYAKHWAKKHWKTDYPQKIVDMGSMLEGGVGDEKSKFPRSNLF